MLCYSEACPDRDARRPTRIAPGPDRRIDILKSAAAAFRRRGYHGASVDEIASALEMTKGNLYYYFRNKEEILYACHDYSLDVLLALLEDVQAEASPPDVKLRKLVLAFVHVILDELQGTALTLDLQALSPPLLRKVIARRDAFDRGVRAIIQQGMDQGLLPPGRPEDGRLRGDGRGELDHAVVRSGRTDVVRSRSAPRSPTISSGGLARPSGTSSTDARTR